RLRVSLSCILDEVQPPDRHRDVKLLRNTFRSGETPESLEKLAFGLLAPVARKIKDRQAHMIRMRECRQRCSLKALNELVVSHHLSLVAVPGGGIGDVVSGP